MRVAVVSEYYPRAHDPVLGVWAHRQALAARDAGADVRVLVLHRPIPPLSTPPRDLPRATRRLLRQPRHATLDGIDGRVRPLRRAAAPAGLRVVGRVGGAVARARAAPPAASASPSTSSTPTTRCPPATRSCARGPGVPLVVSVHGSDVFFAAPSFERGRAAVRRAFERARLVLANSEGVEAATRTLGARRTRVVHLGTDLPPAGALGDPAGREPPTARVGRAPRGPQAPRRRAARDGGPARPPSVAALSGHRRRPRARRPRAARRGAARRGPGRVRRASSRTPRRCAARARAPCSCCRASTRRSASPMWRRWRAACRRSAAAASPAPGRSPPPAAGSGSWRPATPTRSRARSTPCSPTPRPCARPARRRGRPSRRAFTWERCGIETVRAYEDALG